jgi:hypothetical protein
LLLLRITCNKGSQVRGLGMIGAFPQSGFGRATWQQFASLRAGGARHGGGAPANLQ